MPDPQKTQEHAKEKPSADSTPGNQQNGNNTAEQTPAQEMQGKDAHLSVVNFSLEKTTTQPLFAESKGLSSDAPLWLRPFFSLTVQLTSVLFLLLSFSTAIIVVLRTQTLSSTALVSIAVIVVLIGTLLGFALITLLLHPLLRVTDAAQAIALGDLKQRNRLPLRLPPQDEVDRLAGSLNEMVTHLEEAKELRIASEKRFSQFFSDASHQLRTPLTSLRGFTEVLLRGAKDDPETATRILKLMKGEAQRMTNLINDLLTLARLDDGHPTKMQYVDLLTLATEGIEQAKMRAKDDRNISLALQTQRRLGTQGNPDRLQQLLFILLDNALKYGRPAPDGTITLQLDRQNGQVVLRVIDNGEGIAKEDLSHIFDSFYRGQQKHTSTGNGRAPVGTGLGLTIAVTIVRAHHGTLSVYSEPGKGTTFTVHLPCVD